jgi:DNA replication protein DnaC
MSAQRLRGNPNPVKSSPAVKQSDWRNKWLRLEETNPKVRIMAESVERFCAEFASNPKQGRKLVIWGPNGCGKTHAGKAAIRWCFQCAPIMQFIRKEDVVATPTCAMSHWPTALDNMRSGDWSYPMRLAEYDMLLIDEIGGEHDPNKIGVDKLCRVLSSRDRCSTIITTNIVPDRWAEVFDRRVESRLFRDSVIVDMDGVEDYQMTR